MLPFSGRLRRRPPACENSIVIVTQCNKIAFQPGFSLRCPVFFAVPRFATNGEKYRLGSVDREAFRQMCRTIITDVCIVFTRKQEQPPRGYPFRYKLRMG